MCAAGLFAAAGSPAPLLLLALGGLALLVVLMAWLKVNPFVALLLAALVVGWGAGGAAGSVLKSFQDGLGATLGGIAAVISLGAMLGRLLAESGGAHVLAQRFSSFFGPERVGWCIAALALAVGLVTWFAVGLLLLLPVLLTLSRETRRPLLLLAIPLLSFLSVMHGLMPPHPGPVVAVDALHANTGKVLALGFLVGIPTAAVAGPLFARWAVRRLPPVEIPAATAVETELRPRPGFGATLFVVTLPIALMMLSSAAELMLGKNDTLRSVLAFTGHPVVALTLALLVAVAVFGKACGFTRAELLSFTEKSMAGIGMTLLVVGGGGGFARVLKDAGVAESMGSVASQLHLPPLVYAWLVAAFIRVATGSATVAITTAVGLMAPVLAADSSLSPELLVLSLGFGSLFLSHVNDGGFWIVKDCLGLTVQQTLRTWTITETLIGIVGLCLTLVLDLFL